MAQPSGFPFTTIEPPIFQTEVVVKTTESERVTFIAENGKKRRVEFDPGGSRSRVLIYSDKTYLLDIKDRTFVEYPLAGGLSVADDPFRSLLIGGKPYAEFVKLGSENGIDKFSVRLDDSGLSEALIYVDTQLGLPVKQEFYSISADGRTLQYSVELRNIRLEADESLFRIPDGFRRVGSIENDPGKGR
ncbi:MAG: hypothetical protein ABI539_06015 [Acidobacteriota bacterium]